MTARACSTPVCADSTQFLKALSASETSLESHLAAEAAVEAIEVRASTKARTAAALGPILPLVHSY